MKMRTLGSMIAFSAIASPFLYSCGQPQIVCTAAAASTAAQVSVLTVKGSAPACASEVKHPSGVPLAELKYDLVGFATYHPDLDPDKPGEGEPDFSKGTVALQSDTVGQLIANQGPDPNADHKPYAIGEWTSIEPDENGICKVGNIKPAEQNIPKVDAVEAKPDAMPPVKASPEVPAVDVKYEWSNLKIYVTAAAQGTQYSADLTYTQDSCTVDYHVIGFWPEHDCVKRDAADKLVKDSDGNYVPDDARCCPNADPSAGRFAGSGINPDFPVKCDHELLTCVLDNPGNKDIPVLAPDWSTKLTLCGKTATNETR